MPSETEIFTYQHHRNFMDQRFPRITPLDFYRELFPSSSFERAGHQNDHRPNGILTEILPPLPTGNRRTQRTMICDDLKAIRPYVGSDRFGIIAPIGYSGLQRTMTNAYTLFALAFDLDEPRIDWLLGLFNSGAVPHPTFMVLSGHGLHLYYQFEIPQPLYPRNKLAFKELKKYLTPIIWNVNTSRIQIPQYEGLNQGFRIVGGPSKLGAEYPVLAWRTGAPVQVADLVEGLPDSKAKKAVQDAFGAPGMTWEEAKRRYPDWAKAKESGQKAARWHIKRDLYDWWKKQVRFSSVGHRYFYLMALAVYAKKCGIDKEELTRDALAFVDFLDSSSPVTGDNPFTQADALAAIKAYNDAYITFTRDAISHLTGISMPTNRRNYRKQSTHLARARAVQAVDDPEGKWRNRDGAPTKEKLVRDYIDQHPEATPTQIARALGISRPTVYKYRAR